MAALEVVRDENISHNAEVLGQKFRDELSSFSHSLINSLFPFPRDGFNVCVTNFHTKNMKYPIPNARTTGNPNSDISCATLSISLFLHQSFHLLQNFLLLRVFVNPQDLSAEVMGIVNEHLPG